MRLSLSLKYILSTILILLIVMGVTLGVVSRRHEQLVMAQIEMQAKALFQQVVITRRWIADHGGVYVEKLPWVNPNPYLSNGTIQDLQGKRYVKENPAMVTKQLSEYAQKEGLYIFHITSLKLINRENAPDEFEERALRAFEGKKIKEASGVTKTGNSRYFRYIAPLYVEKACLPCHSHQGYRVGDVRGGISVSMPMDYAFAVLKSDRRYMIAGGGLIALALMLSLFFLTRRMVLKPVRTMMKFMDRFSREGDPDIPVLKTGDELEELSKSFVAMAKSIHEYQSCLEEKIAAATRGLRDANEVLCLRNRQKSDFIAKLSHELRTPLTSIKGAMDYISVRLSMRESEQDQDLSVFFEMIKKNAERLIRLLRNVLDYERIELGKFEMNFAKVNLKEVFEEVIASFRPLAEEKKIEIVLNATDVFVSADEDRIKQVLTNLVSNALNFSSPLSSVTVSLELRDGRVWAQVEDTGSGVRESEREIIFTQFYTRDVKDGTGLGLAICKGIIEAHDGQIGVENGSGGGSNFWFSIPGTERTEPASEKTASCDR